MGSLVQGAVVSSHTLPGAMEVIRHHINKIQVPGESHVTLSQPKHDESLMGKTCWVTCWCTLQSPRFHSQHQWFLSQQTQQQLSLNSAGQLMFPQPDKPRKVPVHHKSWRSQFWFIINTTCAPKQWFLYLTLHNSVNLCLSSGGLPLAPGYSQSKSSPSKLYVLSSLIEDWMNAFLLACVDTIVVNLGISFRETKQDFEEVQYSDL